MARCISAVLLILAVLPCVQSNAALWAVGGNLQSETLYNALARACVGNRTLLISTAASVPYSWDCDETGKSKCNDPSASNSKMNAIFYQAAFEKHGIQTAWIPADVADNSAVSDKKWVDMINSQKFGGVFFSGGDQMRYTQTFGTAIKPSPVLKAILDQHVAGNLMIAGSSAGTMVMTGNDMITGGVSWNALDYGGYPDKNTTDDDLQYATAGGFGLFRWGVTDTHYGQRGRQGRHAVVLWETKQNFGFGINEDTVLIDDGTGILSVAGDTGVTVLDMRKAKRSDTNQFGLEGITMSYITDGDSWDANTNTPKFGVGKIDISGHEEKSRADSSDDVFSYNGSLDLVTMISSLMNSRDTKVCGESYSRDPTYQVCATKTSDTKGAFRDEVDGSRLISVTQLTVSMMPLDNAMLAL